jgi:hypothetical protein
MTVRGSGGALGREVQQKPLSTLAGLARRQQPDGHGGVRVASGREHGGVAQHTALCQPRAEHPQQAGRE